MGIGIEVDKYPTALASNPKGTCQHRGTPANQGCDFFMNARISTIRAEDSTKIAIFVERICRHSSLQRCRKNDCILHGATRNAGMQGIRQCR